MIPSRKLLLLSMAALLALLTVFAAWIWAHEGHQPLATRGVTIDAERGLVTLGPEAASALNVQAAEVRSGAIQEELVAQATVTPSWRRHAYVSARLGGAVVALRVQPGQLVKQNEIVAEVESLELADLQRELLDARNKADLSGKIVSRLEDASSQAAVPEQTLLEARARHQQNLGAVDIARIKLLALGAPQDVVRKLLRDRSPSLQRRLPVRSPISGAVIHVDVGVGQTVEPMEHLMEIIDPSHLEARIRILEKDVSLIRVGQVSAFRFPVPSAGSGVRRAPLRVKERYLDPHTHQVAAWAELDNRDGRLLPGMVGQAHVELPAEEGLLLPSAALVASGAERYVLVEEGPRQYRRVNVAVQRARGDTVQIAANQGLYPGDRVVTAGSHELAALFVQSVLRLSPEAERNTGLRTVPARKHTIAETISLSGMVDLAPSGQAVVSSRLAGVLHRIAIDRDQLVRAGDVVAEVRSPELLDLQLELLRSHLQLRLQEATLKRLRAARQAAAIPERTIAEEASAVIATRQRRDSRIARLRTAGLSVEQIAGITERKVLVEALPVRAPISGVVVRFRAVLGQAVKADAALFEVQDLSKMSLRVFVPERDSHRVRIGQRGRARLTSDPTFTVEVIIERRGLVVSDGSRMAPFWVSVKNPPSTLLPGMLSRVALILFEHPPALAVPRSALLSEGGLRYLFVRNKGGVFERRPVEVGRSDDLWIEITRGLSEGETVAVSAVAELQTGYASLQ